MNTLTLTIDSPERLRFYPILLASPQNHLPFSKFLARATSAGRPRGERRFLAFRDNSSILLANLVSQTPLAPTPYREARAKKAGYLNELGGAIFLYTPVKTIHQ